MPDPDTTHAAEIAALLRGEGDPAARYTLAREVAAQMSVEAAKAARDLAAQLGSLAAAAAALGTSVQAISQLLARHGLASPRGRGRPKTAAS